MSATTTVAPTTKTRIAATAGFTSAQVLTALVIILGTVAAMGGLLIPGLYREPAGFVPVLRGQDLVTLLAMPVLAAAVVAARGGSPRATLIWIGLLGYVLYTYAGAAVGYYFNRFFLIYVALFSTSAFALISVMSCMDVAQLRKRFDSATPHRPVAGFMILIALMLAGLELGENVAFLNTGVTPSIITRSGGITNYVYVFDLGMIAPLTVLAAVWLSRGVSWGYLLAGVILTKGATMGLALLSMEWFSVRAGQGSDGLEPMWAVIAFGSLGLAFWFYRHCRVDA